MNTSTFKSSGFAPEFGSSLTDGRIRNTANLAALPKRLIETVYAWQQRNIDRRNLLDMSDRLLSDIGIDRSIADREAAKPFWKA